MIVAATVSLLWCTLTGLYYWLCIGKELSSAALLYIMVRVSLCVVGWLPTDVEL